MSLKTVVDNPWPALPYEEFKSTGYLLHMGLQAIGKFKLHTPFEPHWSNVVLGLTSRGITTGLIPNGMECFSIDVDLIDHQIICSTSKGDIDRFPLKTMSVADLTAKLFKSLRDLGIHLTINQLPQEVPNPIPFNQDTASRQYDASLANAWLRILISSYLVMQRYHARFTGITPAIGLMWGTFDLRDVRYSTKTISTTREGYIRRNAMDAVQIESGWWSGNPAYPRPAYYSFTFPQPEGIEDAKLKPKAAHWDPKLKVFILDYDDLRKSKDPENDLLQFLECTYQAGAELIGWDPHLITSGEPV